MLLHLVLLLFAWILRIVEKMGQFAVDCWISPFVSKRPGGIQNQKLDRFSFLSNFSCRLHSSFWVRESHLKLFCRSSPRTKVFWLTKDLVLTSFHDEWISEREIKIGRRPKSSHHHQPCKECHVGCQNCWRYWSVTWCANSDLFFGRNQRLMYAQYQLKNRAICARRRFICAFLSSVKSCQTPPCSDAAP